MIGDQAPVDRSRTSGYPEKQINHEVYENQRFFAVDRGLGVCR